MTRMTFLMIKHNGAGIKCEAIGPTKDGKYAGWISYWKDDRPHICPLVSTSPVYESATEAEQAMRDAVTEIRATECP